jgi:hypothetical protein
MKAYVYLNLDGQLVVKDYTYINTENPGFFSHPDNRTLIVKYWLFDTEDSHIMEHVLRQMQMLKIKPEIVTLFLRTVHFDITTLKLPAEPKSPYSNAS